MSFNLIETSIDNGQPIRLYRFSRGPVTWCYCTADKDFTFESRKYKSTAISDGGIRQSGEAAADTFEITVPASNEIAQMFRGVPPSDDIELTVYDIHVNDPQAVIKYMGSVYSVKFPAEDRATIICNTDSMRLNVMGLRMTWGRGCSHELFGVGCGISSDLYKTSAVVQSKNGLTISSGTFAEQDDNYYSGGYIEWPVGMGLLDRRGIVSHTGESLELLGGTDGIGLGATVTVCPGCNRTINNCHEKYANSENYGGHPHQPGKSPFDGTPIA